MYEEKNKNLKYFIYARKSSEAEDRQMNSIEDQLRLLTELAKKENLNIIEILQESGSAKKVGRKVFNKMMKRIHNGEANAILCWKLNRLARNSLEGGMVSHALETNVIQEIKTPGKSYHPTDNVLMMAVELGMANQYSRDLSRDTKRGVVEKAKRGWLPAPAPLGYKKHPEMKKGEKEIIVDKERFDAVRKIWDLILSEEYNPAQALDYVTEKYGLKSRKTKKRPSGKYSVGAVYNLIKNPFYYGEFEYPKGSGNWYQGKHKPMITKKEFDKVQSLITPHSKTKNKSILKELFPFKEPLFCGECGSSITAERKRRITCDCRYRFSALKIDTCPKCNTAFSKMKNGKLEERIYYYCSKSKNRKCTQKTAKPETIEKEIEKILSKLTLPAEFVEVGLELLKKIKQKENKLEEKTSKIIIKNIKKIDIELKKLLRMRMNEEITLEEYKQEKKELQKEKVELEKTLEKQNQKELEEKAKCYFDFSTNILEEFKNASDKQKKSIFSAMSSNHFLIDGKIVISRNSTLFNLIKLSRGYKEQNNKVRTSKNPYSTTKKTPSQMSNSILLHR